MTIPNDKYKVKTINEVFDDVLRTNPLKPFILYKDEVYTYEQVDSLANGLCDYLTQCGVKKGNRVCFVLPRVPELIISFFAVLKLGGVPVPVNYTLSAAEVENFIISALPSALIVHEKLFFKSTDFLRAESLKCLLTAISVGKVDFKGFTPWNRSCYPLKGLNGVHDPDVEEVSYLNYTTGSTGRPKGAFATHANVYWNTQSAIETMEITEKDVHLCMFASFAHPHELFARAVYTGGTIFLLEQINPKTIAREVADKSVTCMMGLAPMFEMMNNHCKGYKVDSLRIAESGGMYTRPHIISDFKNNFGVPVLSVWGSTETTGIACANSPTCYKDDGSMGKACLHYDVHVLNDEGNFANHNEIGEILIRGRGVVSGYHEDVELSCYDDWYRTGDLGYMDKDGFLYFVERKSGLLKMAGLKIYPHQVELVLMECPFVKEVAVVGKNDRKRGEVPVAFITVEESVKSDDVVGFCKGKLAEYMVPRHIYIVEELPKIGSGKINKKAIREKLKRETCNSESLSC